MSLAGFHVSFRFQQSELALLDQLVNWERSKGPMMMPHLQANRTSVIKALIEREALRLDDEEDKMREQIERNKVNDKKAEDGTLFREETVKERKSRLQRERRLRQRKQSA